MKKITLILAGIAVLGSLASCNKALEVKNTNQQTTYDFGNTESDLQEAIIACYNRIRLEGTFARVGYMHDVLRGDECWTGGVWYQPADRLNSPGTIDVTDQWIWRDSYHVVNRCNFVLSKLTDDELSEKSKYMKGEALFLRGLAYYQLATYYQTVPLFNDYGQYGSLSSIYSANMPQDDILDQVEDDFAAALQLLPSKEKGGEWANGRATSGAAAGLLARTYMFRHKFSDALTLLRNIIDGEYGTYDLVADYGANFMEGSANENNIESIFEVQFLDYGMGGTDEEWTPVNISSNATQGHACESNFAPATYGGWADVAMSNWLYNLYKSERCTDGRLDPRLYWTSMSYEPEYDVYHGNPSAAYPDGDPRCNIVYNQANNANIHVNDDWGGIPVAKYTYARAGICEKIVAGLHCGINIRVMRYSDVLLRAAECINEISGPTQEAIDLINKVRNRVALPSLELADFPDANTLFEQIANVERPKEFGCENGRGTDLIRWGFFYDQSRLTQIAEHSRYKTEKYDASNPTPVTTANLDAKGSGTALSCSDDSYTSYFRSGHEYFPIFQGIRNENPKLNGNSANNNIDNAAAFRAKGWTVRPVVDLNN